MANFQHNFINVDLINAVIARLDAGVHLDMSSWEHCICGQMARILHADRKGYAYDPVKWGATQLNISQGSAEDLFCSNRGSWRPTREQAINCLTRLRNTGVVDWAAACST